MPRLQMSHDTLIRIAAALVADSARRDKLGEGFDVAMHQAVIQQNTDIVGAINRARAKDGLLPLPTKVTGR
jgi:hypothetical protein